MTSLPLKEQLLKSVLWWKIVTWSNFSGCMTRIIMALWTIKSLAILFLENLRYLKEMEREKEEMVARVTHLYLTLPLVPSHT